MQHRVCPWWLGYWLICPVRHYWQSPHKLLASYVHESMTVLEPGPGMGYFTLELARLVGSSGRVVAVDVQPKMIDRLKRRAKKAGLLDRVDARVASAESMGVSDLHNSVDFTLAFAMVHEFPEAGRFFAEVAAASRCGAQVLLAEPSGHVKAEAFDGELQAAAAAGFDSVERPSIRRSHAALLKKNLSPSASVPNRGDRSSDPQPSARNALSPRRRDLAFRESARYRTRKPQE